MYAYHIRLRAQKTEIQLSSTSTKKETSRQNMQNKRKKANRQIIIYYDKTRKLITFVESNMRKQRDEINRQPQQTVACA